ncbi:hypothetical protein G5B39_18490 (plasmid) [Rhodobacteraceae bacterium SC52]|nr:hypothetical protein G5B39_18490 [Rhodobacteraceae bacterium SC52]
MTTLTVSTSAELMDAFAMAQDGDRIELVSGAYETVTLAGRDFATGITIAAVDPDIPPILTDSLHLIDVAGVTVQDIDIDAAQIAPEDDRTRVMVENSDRVVLKDMVIEGYIPTRTEGQNPDSKFTNRKEAISDYGYDIGVQVHDSSSVTLSGLELFDLRSAVGLQDAYDTVITGVDIHDVREGINMHDVRGVLIEDSAFHNFKPWKHDKSDSDDHPDMIQFYGANSVFGVHDVTISNNQFWQDPDDLHTQTIYGSLSGESGFTHSNFTITGNTIVNGHLNAISIYDVDGVVIEDNVILPKDNLDDDPLQIHTPGIVLVGSTDARVEGNTFLAYSNGKDVKAPVDQLTDGSITIGTNTILSTDPDSPLFWRTVAEQVAAGTWTYGGADALPTDIDAQSVVGAALDLGMIQKDAPSDGGFVSGGFENSVLLGSAYDDVLRSSNADSVMQGNNGSDKFVFNFRNPDEGALHVVVDLDFDKGDFLQIIGPDGGYIVTSADRLVELVEDGTLTASATAFSSTIVSFSDLPSHQIELMGMTLEGAAMPTGTDADALIKAALDLGMVQEDAPSAGGVVKAGSADSVLLGSAYDDILRGSNDNTVMMGAEGADKFVFNFRSPDDDGALHVVSDLDFDEGDFLQILGPDGGYVVTSADRLAELVTDGTLTTEATSSGGTVLALADLPSYQIELAFQPMDELLGGL